MSVNVKIPAVLWRFTGGAARARAEGSTVLEVVQYLERTYPGLRDGMFAGEDRSQRLVNIYINGEEIRFRQGLDTEVPEGAEVTIIPALSGG